MTSDDFFRINKDKFDVIFIDGLHTYQQVRKDIINSMKCLNPGGWIAMHDMLPGNWIEAHVPDISSGAWYGDVWKVGFELAKTPGIEFRIVKIDGGVGLFKIQQKNAELADLTDQLAHANFAYFYHNFDLLSVIDWSEAKEWIQKNLK
jgi:predicted O-methyltransferase YrrM